MKKFIFTIMFVLPLATWQVYNPITKTLTVYKGSNPTTGIYFQGDAAKYDGGASQPATGKWTASWLPSWGPATTTPAK